MVLKCLQNILKEALKHFRISIFTLEMQGTCSKIFLDVTTRIEHFRIILKYFKTLLEHSTTLKNYSRKFQDTLRYFQNI